MACAGMLWGLCFRNTCRGLRWLLLAPAVLACIQSCSGSSDDTGAACAELCDELCSAFLECRLGQPSSNCVDDCATAYRGGNCSEATPPTQYTCSELGGVFRCAEHCASLCSRAPDCGEFDEPLCRQGCARFGPPVCNAASVPARTCDEIKPEARFYEQAIRALRDGDFVDGVPPPSSLGLCRSSSDCRLGLACQPQTNTCGACSSNVDCVRDPLQAHLCANGSCVPVDCVADAGCFGTEVCSASNECVQCRNDADCASVYRRPSCDVVSGECVECQSQEHCVASYGSMRPACNESSRKCVECLSNDHCAASPLAQIFPVCDLPTQDCVECLTDDDCVAPLPTCDTVNKRCTM